MRDILERHRLERRLAAAFAAFFFFAAVVLHVVSGLQAKRAAPASVPPTTAVEERARSK